ncbi:MAG: DUF2817 domain-containing protein [Alphaproteobacteria bacterium]|nr:DUF2817 domain-containing protein [Alphaproteobacteria bacterium]
MGSIFHDSYAAARAAFREDAVRAGFRVDTHGVGQEGPDGKTLTVDVAVRSKGLVRRAVVVSSGTHGVEGYFGSAVQLDLLRGALSGASLADGDAIVLIHAVNPYGMAWQRRVNEDGVDLNRNFVVRTPDAPGYQGAPAGYVALDGVLNPPSGPGGLDLFPLPLVAALARDGMSALKDAVAGGQYAYPKGLFFGGHGPSASLRVLDAALPPILGQAERVVHLDLHTGSGRWGTYVLAVDLPASDPRVVRLGRELGADRIQGLDPSGVLYAIQGALGPWLQARMPDVTYDCLLAEYGTYNVIRVLSALRFENRVWWHAHDDEALRARARGRLVETFCPASPSWRTTCVGAARATVEAALRHTLAVG